MKNEMYHAFAAFYDALTGDVAYEQQADFILQAVRRYSKTKPEILLDVGCGTGTLCFLLCEAFADVIGADNSEEMLQMAREKQLKRSAAHPDAANILFLNQGAQQLDLYGTADVITCTLDTLNHIIELKELEEAFDRISLFLMPGGLFIFDLNTRYKQEKILGDNTFVYDVPGVYCVWQNAYDPKRMQTAMDLDLFYSSDGQKYVREYDGFDERYYAQNVVSDILEKNSLELLGVFDDYQFAPLCGTSQRMTYVTRKITKA